MALGWSNFLGLWTIKRGWLGFDCLPALNVTIIETGSVKAHFLLSQVLICLFWSEYKFKRIIYLLYLEILLFPSREVKLPCRELCFKFSMSLYLFLVGRKIRCFYQWSRRWSTKLCMRFHSVSYYLVFLNR